MACAKVRPSFQERCHVRFFFPSQNGSRTWRIFTVVLALGLGFCCSARAKDWGHIKFASEGARPPFNYLDNNQLAGFEIDLANEICARLKDTCEFVPDNWDDLIPHLLAGQYDAIIAAMDITDERREKIQFTKPYVNMPSAFVAQREAAIPDVSPTGLAGKRIGSEARGAHEAFLSDVYKQSDLRPYATLEEAILDLGAGRIDLVLGDRDAVGEFLKTRKEGDCCRIIGTAGHDPAYFGDGLGIGLRKADQELKQAMDDALEAIKADGTFARLRAKYFDFELE